MLINQNLSQHLINGVCDLLIKYCCQCWDPNIGKGFDSLSM